MMNTPILPPDRTDPPESDLAPTSVRALDMHLNQRVATARSDEELNAGLRLKIVVKRRLLAVPPALLDAAAVDELAQLQESV
jgi:hypothetical protein